MTLEEIKRIFEDRNGSGGADVYTDGECWKQFVDMAQEKMGRLINVAEACKHYVYEERTAQSMLAMDKALKKLELY